MRSEEKLMVGEYLIGIDIGTSGCKSILIDGEGKVIGYSLQEYPLLSPRPGWTEQDPADWWKAVQVSVWRLLRKTGISSNAVKCLGLSGQMHGLVALDKDCQVLRPAILWNDQRSMLQCQRIHEIVGGIPRLLELTNNQMLPGYTGGKILWMREQEPKLYKRTRLFLNPKDYIRYVLTGEFATEVSDASGTGLFDVRQRRWCDQLLTLLNIPIKRLPRCFESPEITGRITKTASEVTGLPVGLPVVGGGGDAVIQTTGMGLVKPGILGITIGTAGIVAMGLDRFHPNTDGRLQIFCNNSPGTWHVMGVTLAAGGSYRWFRDALCEVEKEKARQMGQEVYQIMEEIASAAPAGSRGLIFLPYLIGERCPYSDPAARGGFIGLSLQHGRPEITRAILEGVVFSLRDVFELINTMESSVKEIRTSGGGSLSSLWRQIQADVFQCPVITVSGSREGGAYGAALVAGIGVGIWKSVNEAVKVLKIETETIPDPRNKQVYEKLYGVYHGLYKTLKPSFDAIAQSQRQEMIFHTTKEETDELC